MIAVLLPVAGLHTLMRFTYGIYIEVGHLVVFCFSSVTPCRRYHP